MKNKIEFFCDFIFSGVRLFVSAWSVLPRDSSFVAKFRQNLQTTVLTYLGRSECLPKRHNEWSRGCGTAVDNLAQQSPEDEGGPLSIVGFKSECSKKYVVSKAMETLQPEPEQVGWKKSHSNSMLFVSKIKENEIVTVNKGQEKQNWYFSQGGPALSWMSAVLCHKCHRCRKIV